MARGSVAASSKVRFEGRRAEFAAGLTVYC